MITIPLEFTEGDTPEFTEGDTPEVNNGTDGYYFVACRSMHDGKVRVFGAHYLNAYPLHFEYGCEGCPQDETKCPAYNGDGCPTTGWFDEVYNPEYDRSFEPVSGEVLAFAKPPKFTSQ